ncbi:LL-diaminopimelate aminotransferase, chloroplastic, partial [Tetrabaena socialis]
MNMAMRPAGCAAPARSACRRHGRAVVVKAVAAPEKTGTVNVQRNENFGKLRAGYLFPEIARRRKAHQDAHPDAK